MIAGRDVPHTHLHLIPSNSMHDLRKEETLDLSPEEMKEMQSQILNFL